MAASSSSSGDLEEAFEAARAEFVSGLKRRDLATARALSKATSIQDVVDAIAEVEAQQQRSGSLRALGRLEPFVKGLQEYAGVIEVFIQAKQDVLSLIWGPLKFILEAVSKVITLFGKIVEVFGEISRLLPQFQHYRKVLGDDRIQPILIPFYKEILALYSTLLLFLKHPGRNTFLESLWPNVRGKIGVILDHIKDHERVMLSEVTLEHVLQSHRASERDIKAEELAEAARNRQYWNEMKKDISPRLYDDKLSDLISDSCVDSGEWLEKHVAFRNWRDGMAKNRCLWLSGIPGAGKTYLVANAVRRLQDKKHHVLFAFFSYKDPRPSRTQPLHSLLFQALSDDESLRPEIFSLYSSNERKFTSNPDWVRDLLLKVLQDTPTFIVLDGLDELDEKCRGQILQDLFHVLESCNQIKLLVSSREDSDLKKRLTGKRAIQIRVHENNRSDMENFVEMECHRLLDSLRGNCASDEMCNTIQGASRPIIKTADGMVLYAKLVFRMAADFGNEKDIKAVFLNLPQNLDEAYGRMLARLEGAGVSIVVRTVARKILSWVACARRTLREEELLQILAIIPEASDFTKGWKDYRDMVRDCGPIIEVSNGFIQFVHFSAKEYLLSEQSNRFLDLASAHIEAATTCAAYLSFSSLDPIFGADVESLQRESCNGAYVFLDYAVLSWLDHVRAISSGKCDSTTDSKALSTLTSCLQRLLDKRGKPFQKTASAKMLQSNFRIFGKEDTLKAWLCSIAYFTGRAEHGLVIESSTDEKKSSLGEDPTNLLAGLKHFRAVLETLLCLGPGHILECRCEHLSRLYGKCFFKCDRYHCAKFRGGYPTASLRNYHLDSHNRMLKPSEAVSMPNSNSASSPSIYGDLDEKPFEISDDIAGCLRDAVCSDDQVLLRSLLQESLLRRSDYENAEIVQLASLKASLATLELVVRMTTATFPHMLMTDKALAVAIETENLPKIKLLLSLCAEIDHSKTWIVNEWVFKQIMPKRCGAAPNIPQSHLHRALSLGSPPLMEFLVEECGVSLPSKLENTFAIFHHAAFRNSSSEDIATRLEGMKRYIVWPEAYSGGVEYFIEYGIKEGISFCFENGVDPNIIRLYETRRVGLLELAFLKCYKSNLAGIIDALLRGGVNPKLGWMHSHGRKNVLWLEAQYEMDWDELAKAVLDGESLEGRPIRGRGKRV